LRELAENVRGGIVERAGHGIAEKRADYLLEQLTAFFAEKDT
jgi:hypothetical protein